MWKIGKIEKFRRNIGKIWRDWEIFGDILTKFYANFEKVKVLKVIPPNLELRLCVRNITRNIRKKFEEICWKFWINKSGEMLIVKFQGNLKLFLVRL